MGLDDKQKLDFCDSSFDSASLEGNNIEKQLLSGTHKYVNCNLCGNDNTFIFAVEHKGEPHKRRVKCKKCGLIYSNPQATDNTLKKFYENLNNVKPVEEIIRHHESLVSQYNRIFLNLANKKDEKRKFLDIGCSTGHFINVGRRYEWDVYGVEISQRYVKYAREKFGLLNVQCIDLLDANYPDNFFDYVWLWHVLEHVTDPIGLLFEINRIMKIGAELRIGVPCVKDPIYLHIKWRGSEIKGFSSDPAHTCEFTPKALKKMVEKTNFRVNHTEIYYNPGSLEKLLTYRSSRKAKTTISFLYYLSKTFPNLFGHRLAVDCVKK